jgi:EmrB/QacA subfamily drug resistance transporter
MSASNPSLDIKTGTQTPDADQIVKDAEKSSSPPVSASPTIPPQDAPPSNLTESEFKADWRLHASLSALMVLTVCVALDATSLSVALPVMAKELNAPSLIVFWAGTSFLLSSTVFQPVAGSLSHIFGRRPVILACMLLFTVGSIIAAVAKSFTVVIVGRAIQGIGGGGIINLTEIILSDLVPLRERGKWFSLISAMWAVGTVFGPLLGGGFAQNVNWTWIFWINLPFIGVATPLVWFFLHIRRDSTNESMCTKLGRVDWIGLILLVVSLTGFLVALSWGGVQYPWKSWHTLVPLIVCAFGLGLTLCYEYYIAKEPLIRLSVFANRTANLNYFGTVIHGLVLFCVLYYLPFYYEGVKGYSPILAGVALFPQTFTVAPASTVVGFLITKTGIYRPYVWGSWFLATLGSGISILLDVDTSIVAWIFINIIPGLGMGGLFAATALALQAASTDDNMGHAISMFAFLRTLGQCLGLAVGGVVFQNRFKHEIETMSGGAFASQADALSHDASATVQIIKSLANSNPLKPTLIQSYASALKGLWIVMTVFCAIALISSLGIKALTLNRPHEGGQSLVRKKADVEEGVKSNASES